jgi:hypothetical protein
MLIRLLSSACIFLGTLLLGGGIFYAEYLYPKFVADSKQELQELVDTIAEIEKQEVTEFGRFILFSADPLGYQKALREKVVDKASVPEPSNDFWVEAFVEGPILILRGFTAPNAILEGRRPVLVYQHEIDDRGASVKKTANRQWLTLSGGDARLASLLNWLLQ